MNKYDSLREFAKKATAEEKLAGLSNELRTPILTVIGFGEILRNELVEKDIEGVPADISIWIEKLIAAGNHIRISVDILTGMENLRNSDT